MDVTVGADYVHRPYNKTFGNVVPLDGTSIFHTHPLGNCLHLVTVNVNNNSVYVLFTDNLVGMFHDSPLLLSSSHLMFYNCDAEVVYMQCFLQWVMHVNSM